MPLTNKEKQRLYRERRDQDPRRRADYLAKTKDKYKTDLAVGKRQLISDMSDRNKRRMRKT